MENFKKGEKVEIVDIGFCPWGEVKVGDIAEIMSVNDSSDYELLVLRNGKRFIANKNRIVKYKEKVNNQFTECAKNLHNMYTAMVDAGFTEMQAWEMIMASIRNSLKL